MPDAQAVVDRIIAAPAPKVTTDDAAVLMACPQRTLMMEKLLAVHFNQTGDHQRALIHAKVVFQHERTAENAKNIALMYRRCKQPQEGIDFCRREEEVIEDIAFNDLMTMLHWDIGDSKTAAQHGTAGPGRC